MESIAALPQVVSLHITQATKLPMVAKTAVEIRTGGGIIGDRYEGARHRHVSIQTLEELDEASARLGAPIDPALTRRNITLSGGRLPHAPGSPITIGAVEFEVVRQAAPCRVMDFEVAEGAMQALRRRAGVICRTISGGIVALGDDALM